MSASGYIEYLAKSSTCLINSQELTRLTSIWKDRGVTMETKVKLAKVLVFPIVLYGAETWTMGKHERRKIDAFVLWCW